MAHIYSFFEHWFGPYEHVAGTALVSIILIVFAFAARRALRQSDDPLRPESRLSVRTGAELVVGLLRDFVVSTMGEHGRKYVPLFGAIFVFIFANNVLGLIPSFNPPTANVNTNFAVALVVFALTHVIGLKVHGVGYLKHFAGPVLFLAPLMIPIELISHVVRPISLTVRLYGNMTGDHAVIVLFTDLAKVVIPSVFLAVGLFISFVQAMVFTMLSMVYIAFAMAEDH